MMRKRLGRAELPLRIAVAVAGIGVVAVGLRTRGLGDGADLTEIIGFLLAMAALARRPQPGRDRPPDELGPVLRQQVRQQLRRETRPNGLLTRDFVPMAFRTAGRPLTLDDDAAHWTTDSFRRAARCLFEAAPGGRLLVTGPGGSGKTLLATMLGLELTDRADDGAARPVPLLISVSSWRPSSDPFARWYDRRLTRAFPVVQTVHDPTGRGPVAELIDSGLFVAVLDGFDEIPPQEQKAAAAEIDDYFRSVPLVVLTRGGALSSARFAELREVSIEPVSAPRAAAYLEHLQKDQGLMTEPLPTCLRNDPHGTVAHLLRVPLYIDLLHSALSNAQVTADELVRAATRRRGVRKLRRKLVALRLTAAFRKISPRNPRRVARFAVLLAQGMSARKTRVLPWWRLADWLPSRFFAAAVTALAAAPSYLLATRMPVGLTRGLAIGVIAGVCFGMLRGRTFGWQDLSHVAAVVPVVVVVEGCLVAGPRQAVADAVEITIATLLALRLNRALLGPPHGIAPSDARRAPRGWWARGRELAAGGEAVRRAETGATLLAIGLVTSAVTTTASLVMRFDDPDRNPVSIVIAAVFGLGIATVSARLLIVVRDHLEPSTVLLRLGRRTCGFAGAYRAGLISAVAIGFGGAIGGGLRLGPLYGLSLAAFFGLVVGLPVGAVGAVIRYLSDPLLKDRGDRGPSTLTTDRAVALASVAGISAAAAAGIGILMGPLHGVVTRLDHLSSFEIVPTDGLLFGLSIGLVVACFNSAWPPYLIARTFLVLTGRSPLRLERLLETLHEANVLRREGPYYRFRHYVLQQHLTRHGRQLIDDLREEM
jgi:NACHT domain